MTELSVTRFRAKIGFNNEPSLRLFQKKLGFTEVGVADGIEVTLQIPQVTMSRNVQVICIILIFVIV